MDERSAPFGTESIGDYGEILVTEAEWPLVPPTFGISSIRASASLISSLSRRVINVSI